MRPVRQKLYIFGPTPPPVHGVSLLLDRYKNYLEEKGRPVKVISTNPVRKNFSDEARLWDLSKLSLFIFYYALYIAIFDRRSRICLYLATLRVALARDLLVALIFKAFNLKIAIYMHGTELADKKPILKRVIKFILSNHEVIYLSDGHMKQHEWLCASNEVVIPNGVKEFCNYNVGINRKNLNLLFFSNVFKAKGINEFLLTLKSLSKSGVVFNAKICGSLWGGYSAASIDELSGGMVENGLIEVCGHTSGADKTAAFEWADVLLFPSHKESFGNVLIEAMSAGVLIISSKTTSAPYILDYGECGFLVDDFVTESTDLIRRISDGLNVEVNISAARERYLNVFSEEVYLKNLDGYLWGDND